MIFHARSEFEDHSDDSLKRHLLRLWMCPEDGIELPEEFAERYGTVTGGDRGGCLALRLSRRWMPADDRGGERGAAWRWAGRWERRLTRPRISN